MANVDVSINDVADTLKNISPDCVLSYLEAGSANRVLIFSYGNVVAGFGLATSDLPDSFDRLYPVFKEFYSKSSHDGKEPCFVLCVSSDIEDLERWASEIETNVYFCRKYVVALSDHIGESLRRLPFLPLETGALDSYRPPTAQTLLKRAGVPAALAEVIVVPSRRSADGVFDDCLVGKHGDPVLDSASEQTPNKHIKEVPVESVKLSSIEIENFRAYKKSQIFNLGSSITFLYGPNGFGKTSLFDAVDFALTGGIGRLEIGSKSADLASLATHLDCEPGSAKVALRMIQNGQDIEVSRSTSDEKWATLNSDKTDRKKLLSRITGGNTPSADRVDNLVDLFRATHLFSQEHQELTKEMRSKSEISSEIVARMLALDDYAAASSKASAIVNHITSRQRACQKIIADADKRIEEDTKVLVDLQVRSSVGQATVDSGTLDELSERLEGVGIDAGNLSLDPGVLRGIRIGVEQRLNVEKAKSERLTSLASRSTNIPELLARQARHQAGVTNVRERISLLSANIDAFREREPILHAEIVDLNEARGRIQARSSSVDWALITKVLYETHLAEVNGLSQKIKDTDSKESECRERMLSASQKKNNLAQLVGERKKAISSLERARNEIQQFLLSLDEYESAVARIEESGRKVISLRQRVSGLEAELELRSADLRSAIQAVSDLEVTLQNLDRNRSDLLSAVSSLRAHVTGEECPFCAHRHPTMDALLSNVRQLESLDPYSDLRSQLLIARSAVQTMKQAITEVTATLEGARREVVASQERLLRDEERKEEYETAAKEFGVLNSADRTLRESMVVHSTETESAIERTVASFDSAQQLFLAAKSDLDLVEAELKEIQAKRRDEEARYISIQGNIASIESDVRYDPANLQLDNENLHALAGSLRIDTEATSERLNAKTNDLQQVQSVIRTSSAELQELDERLSVENVALADTTAILDELIGDLAEYDVGAESAHASVLLLVADVMEACRELELVLSAVVSTELAADAATTAAALSSLKSGLDEHRRARQVQSELLASFGSWQDYFEKVEDLLKSSQSNAVAKFTNQYGPLTSVIQKRLRAVYGFEEVEMESVDSRVVVNVTRGNKKLKPTDYFSQSQQQTLLLGLFLTACTSQTWSAFRPILLDDPVAHFDDLNTYAFLDLILGLLGGSDGRQFIVSTCDERFMQMARKKFRHLGEEARFYRFKAIGENGPEIENLAS